MGLCLGRKTVTKKVHSLVAETFLGKKPSIDHEVCHNDGNPDNNLLENLRWGTAKENAQDRIRHGRNNSPVGTKCHNAKLTDEIVLEIRRSKMTNRYLGEKYGVPNSTIFCVKNFKTWRHVK